MVTAQRSDRQWTGWIDGAHQSKKPFAPKDFVTIKFTYM